MIKNRSEFLVNLAEARLACASQAEMRAVYVEFWSRRLGNTYTDRELLEIARDYSVDYEETEEPSA